MKLSNRSYPHPVVGNSDDVPEADFQATLSFESDKTNFYLTAKVRCSSKTINKMIQKGTACYTIHIECSNTLFRKTYDFTTEDYRIIIPATDIHNIIEVNPFVRAKSSLSNYSPEGVHEDYKDATFEIASGDILAIGDGQTFDATHDVDPLRKVGALMVVVRSAKSGDHSMEADFNTDPDKILITLCEADYLAYGQMKSIPHLTSHLTTTLVLPVLVEAIHILDDDDLPPGKWAGLLQQKLEALDSPAANALEKAQQILNFPSSVRWHPR